jgi:predicted metal-dependent hydrolase
MQFELPFGFARLQRPDKNWLLVGELPLRLDLVRNRRARRYVLRLAHDGTARVAIPRGGSETEARRFAQRNVPWLERQLLRQALRPSVSSVWREGSEILFRGERTPLRAVSSGNDLRVMFADQALTLHGGTANWRPAVERYIWLLAKQELPARVMELAAQHQITFQRVTVRNQRSRWGSCSRHGTISLNWRLLQTTGLVRDYIILHELAHRKEMNHSVRFWREVERLCPAWQEAEKWLKQHPELLAPC